MFIFPPEVWVYRRLMVFTFRGRKGTLHADVVKKVANKLVTKVEICDGLLNTVTGLDRKSTGQL